MKKGEFGRVKIKGRGTPQGTVVPDFITITEASRALDMTRKTVRARIADLQIHHKDGWNYYYPTIEVLKRCFLKPESKKDTLDLNEEKARYYRAIREKLEIEKRKLEGDLVNMDQYDAEQEKYLIEMRDNLLQMGKKMARKLGKISDPDTIANLLNDEVKVIMEDVAQRAGDEAQTAEFRDN